jgi:hypothetical protein
MGSSSVQQSRQPHAFHRARSSNSLKTCNAALKIYILMPCSTSIWLRRKREYRQLSSRAARFCSTSSINLSAFDPSSSPIDPLSLQPRIYLPPIHPHHQIFIPLFVPHLFRFTAAPLLSFDPSFPLCSQWDSKIISFPKSASSSSSFPLPLQLRLPLRRTREA